MRKFVRNDEMHGRYTAGRAVRPFACILGTGTIASAVACMLVQSGWTVVLSHDPAAAVLRRKSAFYDVLFGEKVCLGGVCGHYAATSLDIRRVFSEDPRGVAVTPLDLMSLIVMGPVDLLIDARAEDGARPDLRNLAALCIGVGPAWYGGVNCDFAIPMPQPCERHGLRVPAPVAGYWYALTEPEQYVDRHTVLGKVAGVTVRAPCAGVVLGILRSGLRLPVGAPLIDLGMHMHSAPEGGAGARQIAQEVYTLTRSLFPHISNDSEVQNFFSAMSCLRSA